MEYQGVSAINPEQKEAIKILTNSTPYTFITGPSGSGKTLLAGAIGLERVINFPRDGWKRVIYSRLQVQTGLDLGYLPGDLPGKTDPFIAPFKDNLEEMDYSLPLDHLLSSGKKQKLDFIPIQTLRGRTIPNAYIIIDEAQNIDVHTITTIATRLGKGSKMIFLGNFAQIDDHSGTLHNTEENGFYQLLSRFYKTGGFKYFDHVHLTKVERSEAAAYVEKMMISQRVNPVFTALEERGIVKETAEKTAG